MAITQTPHTYDLIVIGRGTAAAIYLNTLRTFHSTELRPELPALEILVIGMEDPWKGARGYEKGHYIEKINQAKQLFEHGTEPKASMVDTPVDRLHWAKKNESIIAEVARENVLDAEVVAVERDPNGQDGQRYLVKTIGDQTFRAKKVVIAAGAGIESSDREYHHVPDEVRQLVKANHQGVMDLDQFQRGQGGSRTGSGKSVAVIGPAAGTDAIMEAATRGYTKDNVYWLIAGTTAPGIKLTWDVTEARIQPTFTAAEAGKLRPEGCVVRYNALTVTAAGQRVKVATNNGPLCEVDFLVYSVGQRGGGVNRSVPDKDQIRQVPFVKGQIKLEPIYDVNQRFGAMDSSGGAWQHVVGLQLEGSTDREGIMLVGSAASQAARGVDHNYLDREYEALILALGDLTQVFEQQADKEFRELFAWRKFADMIRLRALETQERDYKRKKQAFICGLRIEVNSRLQNVLGSHAKMSVQIRIQHVNNCEKFASELCYMFLLRVRAAMYYRQQEDNKEPKKSVADMLGKGLVRTLPETVSDNRLIGGMQRNIAAVNQHVNVEHVRTAQGVNFLEDQQTIALYIAVHYPNISERRANELVTEIIQERKSQLRGFSAQTMGRWDARLDAEDRQGRGALGYAYHTYF